MKMINIKTKEEARSKAIDFQSWQSDQFLSYEEVNSWVMYFSDLASNFGLEDEFSENGII